MEKTKGELHAELEKYKSFIANSLEGIYAYECVPPVPTDLAAEIQAEAIFDSGIFVECNEAFAKMYGKESAKEILNKKLSEIIKKEAGIIQVFTTFVKLGYYLGNEEGYETDDQGNGHYFLNNTFAVIEDNKVKRVWGTQRDITELKTIQNELQQMQKLESLGVLAGGIAHDFNNILTGILANVSLLQIEENLSKDVLKQRLKETESACLRAKDLTHQLLTFAKGGKPIKHVFDIHNLIRECAKFVLRGSTIICEFEFVTEAAFVNADEGQIDQVFSNLIINSMQAMKSGKIQIRSTFKVVNESDYQSLNEGKYLVIDVIDQGNGIANDELKRVFDPFYTTKKTGHGLGLSSVNSIIQNHNGKVEIESKLNEGTKVRLYLPSSASSSIKGSNKFQSNYSGSGKILVMDDEESIRDVLLMILNRLGFEVTLVQNGTEAISEYEKELKLNTPFKYVFLDLTIPGHDGGLEIIDQLKDLDKNVKALVVSGYSTSPIMSEYEKHGFSGVVKKPFRVNDLINELKRIEMN